MPNNFAYLVFLSWPLVVIYLLNRFNIGKGTLLSLLGAYMFLPASFTLVIPGPDLDKFLITIATILFFIVLRGNSLGLKYLDKKSKFLLLVAVISPFITALTNQERYLHLPGLSLYDGFTNSLTSFLDFIPFLIGLAYFRTKEQHFTLFKYFAIATFIYSFFALFEIRMSPQLHSYIYGYFPHSWIQQNRGDGFRSVVFMGHGLLVAMFLAVGVAFWTSLSKSKSKVFRYSTTFGLIVVLVTLLLSKSMAALIYGLFAFIAIRYFRTTQIYLSSAIMAVIFISYPITSATGLFPHDSLVNIASKIDYQRAGSLEFRFNNEEFLLEHANQKPWFGWGTWGRNRVYDAETGEDISVTDGRWVIALGSSGWMGFLSKYLFLFLPVWIVFRQNKSMSFTSQQDKILMSGHSLIVALIMIDQLPNSSFNPLYWCLVGSLYGRAQVLLSQKSFTDEERPSIKESYTN